MIRHIITITIIVSFLHHSVTSVKAWDRLDVERAPRHRHKYNQPTDEMYEAIPVAVVYEDKDIRTVKSLNSEHTGAYTTESSVKDPNLKDTDNILVQFSRNAKNFKDDVVDTTSKPESNIGIKDTEIINKDKNIEITTVKDSDDYFINFSVNITEADQVTSKYEIDYYSKDHENVMDTKVNKDSRNEKLANSRTIDENHRKNIKLVSHYSTKEIHIPVAVIYDTDADPVRTNKDQFSATSSTIQVPPTSTPKTGINKVNKRRQQKGFILRASSLNKESVETTTTRSPRSSEQHEEIQFENKIKNREQTSVVSKMEQIPVKLTNENSSNSVKKRRQRDPVVPIIETNNEIYSHSGVFRYSYEGGDGTKAFSEGELKTFEGDKTGEAVVGGFSYKDKEGNDFSLSYTADENGYRPVGEHLPTPPPIPPAIARALRYLATKTTPEPVTESQKY